MKKVLKPLLTVAVLATAAFAANLENPLYGPASMDFYSKTGLSWMYKKGDANLAMTAKDWDGMVETKIVRIYEDFGFGLTDRFGIRGSFGYTHDADIDRAGFHNARLGLNYRAMNAPKEAVVWDLYVDSWLGGISEMKAELKMSPTKDKTIFSKQPLSFWYENYANGRWGLWVGTSVGKTFDKLTVSAFGEAQKTFGNNNNTIKIDNGKGTKEILWSMVQQGAYAKAKVQKLPEAIIGVCAQMGIEQANCNKETINKPGEENAFKDIEDAAKSYLDTLTILKTASGDTATAYISGLPKDFNVDTKGDMDYAAGIKALYDLNEKWSIGGGFSWRHRGANSVEALNITNSSALSKDTKEEIRKGIEAKLGGSMEDGIDEFYLSLLGSRQITNNLQLTLFGEYTFDTDEDKSQLGTDAKFEIGLRMNWQF